MIVISLANINADIDSILGIVSPFIGAKRALLATKFTSILHDFISAHKWMVAAKATLLPSPKPCSSINCMSDFSIFFRTWRLISTVPTLLISEIISSHLSTISFGRGSSQLCPPLHTSWKINLNTTVSGANTPRGPKRLAIVFSTTLLVSGSEPRFASCLLKSNFRRSLLFFQINQSTFVSSSAQEGLKRDLAKLSSSSSISFSDLTTGGWGLQLVPCLQSFSKGPYHLSSIFACSYSLQQNDV